MGLRHWGQVVTDWSQIPMPMAAPTAHNPALAVDWCRFCSDTIVAFVRMQADLLREITPECPVTTNLRALRHRFDHFDLAEAIDFVSIESTSAIKPKSADLACEIDMLRSLKKTDIRTPDGDYGFLGHGTKGRQRHLAGRELAHPPRHPAHVHLSTHLPRRDGGAVLPLAAAAHRLGKIPRRRPAPSPAQGRPHLPGSRPDRR